MRFDGIRDGYAELTRMLIVSGISVATMESCTSGLIASLITDTEGASEVFRGGYVTYCNEAKINAGVDSGVICKYGVYSEETALCMAVRAREIFGTDIGIGVTGSFGNADPANDDSLPGIVHFAIVYNDMSVKETISLPVGDRYMHKMLTADCVRERLISLIGA